MNNWVADVHHDWKDLAVKVFDNDLVQYTVSHIMYVSNEKLVLMCTCSLNSMAWNAKKKTIMKKKLAK